MVSLDRPGAMSMVAVSNGTDKPIKSVQIVILAPALAVESPAIREGTGGSGQTLSVGRDYALAGGDDPTVAPSHNGFDTPQPRHHLARRHPDQPPWPLQK